MNTFQTPPHNRIPSDQYREYKQALTGLVEKSRRNSGEESFECPACQHTRRKHRDTKPLRYNHNTTAFKCHHCQFRGYLKGAPRILNSVSSIKKLDARELSNDDLIAPLSDIGYLTGRGLSERTIREFGVGESARGELVFPYYFEGRLVNAKYRSLPKGFRQITGASLVPFNFDSALMPEEVCVEEDGTEEFVRYEVDRDTPLVITEGEIDAMSIHQAFAEPFLEYLESPERRPYEELLEMSRRGEELPAENIPPSPPSAWSLPNGTSGVGCFRQPAVKRVLDQIHTVILAGDFDEPGKRAMAQLAQIIGVEKCRVVRDWGGCKDANELLQRDGGAAVVKAIEGAIRVTEDAGLMGLINEPPAEQNGGELTFPYATLGDLLDANIPEPEEVLHKVERGKVSLFVAETNVGKTTILLNALLAKAAGQAFPPLVPTAGDPVKVAFVDFETGASKAQQSLKKMLSRPPYNDPAVEALARRNFLPIFDAEVDGFPLNLSEHLQTVVRRVKEFGAQIVVIDNVSAGFELEDDNKNAEVARTVMLPLKEAARKLNAAIILVHHTGKPGENSTRSIDAYTGRGASVYGSLSQSVYVLVKNPTIGEGHVVLHNTKTKCGTLAKPTNLRLDYGSLWFESTGVPGQDALTAEDIAAFVKEKGGAVAGEIQAHFMGLGFSPITVKRRTTDARNAGLIVKPNNKAPYTAVDHTAILPEFDNQAQVIH